MKIRPLRKSWVKPNTYGVGEDGRIYRKTKNGWAKMAISDDGGNGYSQTKLVGKDGKRHNLDNHTAVQHAYFNGKGQVVNHKDGDKSNDSVSNLTPMSQSDNIKHAYRTGLESRKKRRKKRRMSKRNRIHEAIVNMAGGIDNVENFLAESSISDINFIHKLHEPNGQLYGYTTDEMGNQIEHSKLSKAEEYYNISKQFISPKGAEERERAYQDYSKLRKQLAAKVAVLHDEMLGMYLTDRKTFDENGKLVTVPEKAWAENEQMERERFNAELQSKAEQGDTLLSNGPEGLINYYNMYSQPLEEELPPEQQQKPVQEEGVQFINEIGDTPEGQYNLSRAFLRRIIGMARAKEDYDNGKLSKDDAQKFVRNSNIHALRASERMSTPTTKKTREDFDNKITSNGKTEQYARGLLARYQSPMEKKAMPDDDVEAYYTKGRGRYKNASTDENGKSNGRGSLKDAWKESREKNKKVSVWRIGHYPSTDKSSAYETKQLGQSKEVMRDNKLLPKWKSLKKVNNEALAKAREKLETQK